MTFTDDKGRVALRVSIEVPTGEIVLSNNLHVSKDEKQIAIDCMISEPGWYKSNVYRQLDMQEKAKARLRELATGGQREPEGGIHAT